MPTMNPHLNTHLFKPPVRHSDGILRGRYTTTPMMVLFLIGIIIIIVSSIIVGLVPDDKNGTPSVHYTRSIRALGVGINIFLLGLVYILSVLN